VILVVNKVDKASPGLIADRLAEASDWDFDAYVPLSALEGNGLEPLLTEITSRLPDGPFFFDPETTTDQPEALLISEIIREKFLDRLREELPHSLTVVIDELEHRENGTLVVSAKALVERESQKGIVIGKRGELIRDAGSAARKELESIFGVNVFVDLRVKVEKDWQRSEQMLDRLGF
ncbi:MAG: GTPase Era, partial [Acidimicrobiia bacterium]|nr:GTPase Era [Acidimicrobiia bacterium]